MTWYVKVKNADKSVSAIMKHDWNDALRDVTEFRQQNREAWIEDADGRVLDENTVTVICLTLCTPTTRSSSPAV